MAKRPNMDLYKIGDSGEFAKTVGEYDVYAFSGIVGDFYDVHSNEEFAKTTRFGKRIAQGALAVGFLSTVQGHMAAKAPSPGAVSYRYDIRFTAPIYIGDTVKRRAWC
jgi:3-hydroxybutyryl-CoA dehydratase